MRTRRQLPMIILMLVKKAVYYLLAAGPILLLGLIAINSRLSADHWEFIEYGPDASLRIQAYAGPVSLARQVRRLDRSSDPAKLRAAIDGWLVAYRAGVLKDIHPVTVQNDGSSPVLEQIMLAKQSLISATLREAARLDTTGDSYRAAHFYADALELSDIAKYSDFMSVSESSTFQIIALGKLNEVLPRLDDQTSAQFLARFESLSQDRNRSLSRVADRVADAYRNDLSREGRPMLTIELARDLGREAKANGTLRDEIEAWRQLSVSESSLTTVYGLGRTAYALDTRYRKRILEARLTYEFSAGASSG